MILLPYHKVVIRTGWKRADAVEIFRRAVFTGPVPVMERRGPLDYFASLENDRFTAYRLLDSESIQTSLNPILHGRFVPTRAGTDVRVHIYPPLIKLGIVGLLAGFPLIFVILSLFNWAFSGRLFAGTPTIVPIFVVIYIFLLSMFAPEARKAEKFLHEIYRRGNTS